MSPLSCLRDGAGGRWSVGDWVALPPGETKSVGRASDIMRLALWQQWVEHASSLRETGSRSAWVDPVRLSAPRTHSAATKATQLVALLAAVIEPTANPSRSSRPSVRQRRVSNLSLQLFGCERIRTADDAAGSRSPCDGRGLCCLVRCITRTQRRLPARRAR